MIQTPAQPTYRSIGRRKQARRDVRMYLGTSSDAAPHIYGVLRAAGALGRLLLLTSSGRYHLVVEHVRDGTVEAPGETLRRERDLREEER